MLIEPLKVYEQEMHDKQADSGLESDRKKGLLAQASVLLLVFTLPLSVFLPVIG